MSITDKPLFYPVINLVGLLIMLAVNALANILPLNGVTTGELSARYPNQFVPPGWVFSIWGVIYLLNIIFVAWTFTDRITHGELLYQLSYWFLTISLLNAFWLVLWHYEQVWLSTVVMILLLLSLINVNVMVAATTSQVSTLGKIALHVNFGVYLGWISVATVANITASLVSSGWNGWGISENQWTAIVLVVILALSLFMVLGQNNIWFGLVVIWAVLGVFTLRQDIALIAGTAGLTLLLTAGSIIYQLSSAT